MHEACNCRIPDDHLGKHIWKPGLAREGDGFLQMLRPGSDDFQTPLTDFAILAIRDEIRPATGAGRIRGPLLRHP